MTGLYGDRHKIAPIASNELRQLCAECGMGRKQYDCFGLDH
jgi:hypothetical protein